MARGDRIFRRLLRLFPAEFRGDFGDDMTRTFEDQRDEVAARGGTMAHLRLWKDTVLGILTTAPREHWDLLRQDVLYGLRNLRRSPGFAAIAIAALAAGIGANTAIFSIVNGVLLEPLPYREPDRLVTLFEQIPGAPVKFGFSAPDFTIVRGATRSFDGIAAYRNVSYELSGLAQSERVIVSRVTPELFDVLGTMPLLGRPFTAEDDATDARVAILSHALWRRAFATGSRHPRPHDCARSAVVRRHRRDAGAVRLPAARVGDERRAGGTVRADGVHAGRARRVRQPCTTTAPSPASSRA